MTERVFVEDDELEILSVVLLVLVQYSYVLFT